MMNKTGIISLVILSLLILICGCSVPGTVKGPIEVRYALSPQTVEYDMTTNNWNATFMMTVTLINKNTRNSAPISTVDVAIWPSFHSRSPQFDVIFESIRIGESLGPGQSMTKQKTFTRSFTDSEMSAFVSDRDIIITVPGYEVTAEYEQEHPSPSRTNDLWSISTSRTPTPITTRTTTAPPVGTETIRGNADGLLVWYTFDEDFTGSGVVPDHSGNALDAVVTGTGVDRSPGISGTQAITFSGKGYLQAKVNPAANQNTVTFSFWFRTDDPTRNYKFASAAEWRGGPGTGWTMATHVPEFWADDGPEGLLLPGQPNADNHFIAGAWTHEAVVYDWKTMKEYTNGTLINTWQGRGAPMSRGVPMAIGGWPQFSGYNFVGQMDDFRIYNRALNADEVAEIYQQESW